MEITQQVRDYAANLDAEKIADAMLEKLKEFKEKGSEISCKSLKKLERIFCRVANHKCSKHWVI
jgi:hypothetical protein